MLRVIVLSVTLFLASNRVAGAAEDTPISVHNAFLTAQEYKSLTQSERQFYVTGIIDGFFLSPFFDAPDMGKVKKLGQCIEGMNNVQIAAIVDKYVQEHPEEWHWGAHVVSYNALRSICNF